MPISYKSEMGILIAKQVEKGRRFFWSSSPLIYFLKLVN